MSRNRNRDIREIRARLERGASTVEDTRLLLEFVDHYRSRVNEVASEGHRAAAKLWKELSDYRFTHALAREVVDPEGHGLHYSGCDTALAAESAEAAARIRTRVVARCSELRSVFPPRLTDALTKGRSLRFNYTNYAGENRDRTVLPIRLRFGSNEWHTTPQWLLHAIDLEKNVERTFALSGIKAFLVEVDGGTPA